MSTTPEQVQATIEEIMKDMPAITAAGPLRGDYVFPGEDGKEVLRITPKGFIYKGDNIEDAGLAYEAFMQVVNSHHARFNLPRRHLHVSFMDEQKALLEPMPVRASDLATEEVEDPEGKVRIYRKRDDWFLSMATEKQIDNTIAGVREFLNENNPVPFTEQQLEHILIIPDQRRGGKRLQVQVRVGDRGDTVTVAFLSGPLADFQAA